MKEEEDRELDEMRMQLKGVKEQNKKLDEWNSSLKKQLPSGGPSPLS